MLIDFSKKYRKLQYIDIMAMNYAEELVKKSDYDRGVMIIKSIYNSKYLDCLTDEVTVYIILAQYYIENGEAEKGRDFLVKIANETVENYEEALEFRGWLKIWNKYKNMVENEIPRSIKINNDTKILSDDDLLKLLLEEVHSGGYGSYLSYNSKHFESTLAAAEKRKMTALTEQLKRIKAQFPNVEIPINSIDVDDIIENNNLNFDDEDELFYSQICSTFPDNI